jgi:hypothetical protein
MDRAPARCQVVHGSCRWPAAGQSRPEPPALSGFSVGIGFSWLQIAYDYKAEISITIKVVLTTMTMIDATKLSSGQKLLRIK